MKEKIIEMLVLGIMIALFIILFLWSSCVTTSRADRNNTHVDSEVYRRKEK